VADIHNARSHIKETEMAITHPYFLRTNNDPDGNAYATLEEARLALDNLINRRSELACSVIEQGDGKWRIRQNPKTSLKIWIEDANGKTVRLK
jgi:hypothetical protein